MSGGKYASETANFALSISAALLGALLTCGTEAVAQAGTAVEMQKLLAQNKQQYDAVLAAQSKESEQALAVYAEAMAQETAKLELQLRAVGVKVPAASGTSAERLETLLQLCQSVPQTSAETIKAHCLSLTGMQSAGEWYRKICVAAAPLIAGGTAFAEKGLAIKKEAEKLLSGDVPDAEGFRALYDRLTAMLPEAEHAANRRESLLDAYQQALARAKALCHITNSLTPFPRFSEENAEEVILRLKEISERQVRMIEDIKSDPALRMKPEDRERAREAVAGKICALLIEKGIRLRQVSMINRSKICYYYYENALLKIAVTDTGMVTFEVIGNPEKKTGFTRHDKQKVLAAMEKFQKEFPELSEQLTERQVVLNLHGCAEPCEEIVTYDAPVLMSEAERAANEEAVLAMLQQSQQFRTLNGG